MASHSRFRTGCRPKSWHLIGGKFYLFLGSGKGVTLLPLPFLRTVRATFIAYSSSISKALLVRETRQPIPALSSRYWPSATQRFRLWMHCRYNLPSSAFPYESCLSGFLVTRHLLVVCSLSRRANSEPVSTPLQCRLRFLQHPLPTASIEPVFILASSQRLISARILRS